MSRPSCPMPAAEVLAAGFLENRARLLEVAAFLDRIDRSAGPEAARDDFRYRALREALETLVSTPDGRAKALLDLWSDPTSTPRASAAGMKGAYGAWGGEGAP